MDILPSQAIDFGVELIYIAITFHLRPECSLSTFSHRISHIHPPHSDLPHPSLTNLEPQIKVSILLHKLPQPLCYSPNLEICQPMSSFTGIDYQQAQRFVGEIYSFPSPEAHIATRVYGSNDSGHGCDEEHEGICSKDPGVVRGNDERDRCAGNGVDYGVVEDKVVKVRVVGALGEARI